HLGGGVPLDAGRGDERAARTDRRHGRRRPAAAALGRHARGPALLRARHRGAGAAPRRGRRRARLGPRGGGRMTVVAEPTTRGTVIREVRTRAVDWIPAIVVFFLAILAWQLVIDAFDIQKFLLPKPGAIVRAFWTQRSTLWSAGWLTLKEALGGFAIGSGLGILFALALARFGRIAAALMPVAIAMNAVPIIAFSPIFNAWFDPLSPAP